MKIRTTVSLCWKLRDGNGNLFNAWKKNETCFTARRAAVWCDKLLGLNLQKGACYADVVIIITTLREIIVIIITYSLLISILLPNLFWNFQVPNTFLSIWRFISLILLLAWNLPNGGQNCGPAIFKLVYDWIARFLETQTKYILKIK